LKLAGFENKTKADDLAAAIKGETFFLTLLHIAQ